MNDIKDLEKKVEEVVEEVAKKSELTAEELKDVAGGLDYSSDRDINLDGVKPPLVSAGNINNALDRVLDNEGTVDERIKR